MYDRIPELDEAIDEESYEYLAECAPGYLKALIRALDKGHTPADIRRYINARTGRTAIAFRCEQAARHHLLISQK